MSRRALLIVAGWLLAAVVAVGTGVAGVRFIGGGITSGTGGDVLTAAEAADELARAPASDGTSQPAATPTPAGPTPADPTPADPTPSQPANVRTFTEVGGSVIAGCTPRGVVLISWSAALGYTVERVEAGPGEHGEVRFRSGRGSKGKGNGESRVRVRCVGGVPTAESH